MFSSVSSREFSKHILKCLKHKFLPKLSSCLSFKGGTSDLIKWSWGWLLLSVCCSFRITGSIVQLFISYTVLAELFCCVCLWVYIYNVILSKYWKTILCSHITYPYLTYKILSLSNRDLANTLCSWNATPVGTRVYCKYGKSLKIKFRSANFTFEVLK
jgi:hypothetical protein